MFGKEDGTRGAMKRVVVDRYGGPEVLGVEEVDDPRPAAGEVCVRVLAAGVSFTDALIRAGTYIGAPKPPFTPGYELVGVVEKVGAQCASLREGTRVAALTVWGGYAERVCLPEVEAIEIPDDADPAKVVSLVLTYMTAYQLLHRMAAVCRGETVLVHGAAGRVGLAILELGALAGVHIYGTASARDRALVEKLGAVAIDYRNEDFLARVRELTGEGVDVALDGIGGAVSIRSFRALKPGGRLVIFGHYGTLVHGHKSWRGWLEWYLSTTLVALWGLLSPRRKVLAYRIQKLRDKGSGSTGGSPRYSDWFREDLLQLLDLLQQGQIHPVVAERLPLEEAKRAHELLEQSASVGKLVLIP